MGKPLQGENKQAKTTRPASSEARSCTGEEAGERREGMHLLARFKLELVEHEVGLEEKPKLPAIKSYRPRQHV